MTIRNKTLVGFLAAIVLLFVAGGIALTLAVHNAGMVVVDVREGTSGCGSDRISIRLPAFVAHAALCCTPSVAFQDACCGEVLHWAGVVRKGFKELADCPDFTIVEIDSEDERVRIRKKGNALIIDIYSDDETVHVEVPIGLVRAAVSKIEKARCRRT